MRINPFARRKPQANRLRSQAPARAPLNWRLALTSVLAVVLLVALGLVGRELMDPNTLPIQAVRIEGKFQHLTTQQLQEAVTPHVSGGFFSVDVDAVMRAARTLPWVDRASVRRIWPDTLLIQVIEQVPLARWGEDAMLNRRGQVFRPAADTIPAGLPQLSGPEGLEAVIAASYFEMGKMLAPAGLKLTRLAQDERRSWKLWLDNGIQLKLGRADAYQHLLRFVRIYPKTLAQRIAGISEVDLRYTNGFAVRWNVDQGEPADRTQGG